jgi:hypothetical protein
MCASWPSPFERSRYDGPLLIGHFRQHHVCEFINLGTQLAALLDDGLSTFLVTEPASGLDGELDREHVMVQASESVGEGTRPWRPLSHEWAVVYNDVHLLLLSVQERARVPTQE